jgi:hypothetical protein
MLFDGEITFILVSGIPAAISLALFVAIWIYELRHKAGTSDKAKSSLLISTSVSLAQTDGEQISFLAELNEAILAWFMAVLGRPERQVNRAVKLLGRGQVNSALRLIERALITNGPQWVALRRSLTSRRLEPKKDLKQYMQAVVNGEKKKMQLELADISEALLYCAWDFSLASFEPIHTAHTSYAMGQYYWRLGSISKKFRFDHLSAARNCFEYALEVFRAEHQTNDEIRTLNQLSWLLSDAAQNERGDAVSYLCLARSYCELAKRTCDSNETPLDLYNQTRESFRKVNELANILL